MEEPSQHTPATKKDYIGEEGSINDEEEGQAESMSIDGGTTQAAAIASNNLTMSPPRKQAAASSESNLSQLLSTMKDLVARFQS